MAVEKLITMAKINSPILEFISCVVNGDIEGVSNRLTSDPGFAVTATEYGAQRTTAEDMFFGEISHYLYAGDTALHMAAAAFQPQIAKTLIGHGADLNARNRHGQQPLHYAADTNHWDPEAQEATIKFLLSAGADPDARDKQSVAPLHRAVRTRSFPAALALLNGGADPRARNKTGSTPLHLAVQTTGRGGSGSDHAREQQAAIIKLLLERGARASDIDGQGKQVVDAAQGEWLRDLLTAGDR
jgi:Ankyrin repeats (many copies)